MATDLQASQTPSVTGSVHAQVRVHVFACWIVTYPKQYKKMRVSVGVGGEDKCETKVKRTQRK